MFLEGEGEGEEERTLNERCKVMARELGALERKWKQKYFCARLHDLDFERGRLYLLFAV